jgi:hypothetical protein
VLAAAAPAASRGRLVRLIDATAVPQAGTAARRNNGVWRVHSAFDLPVERFAFFALTDERAASGSTGSRSNLAKSASGRLPGNRAPPDRTRVVPACHAVS